MRRILLGLAAVVGLGVVATPARAQVNAGYSDPFFLYYGFFVPFQAAQAALPRPEDTVGAFSAQRQMTALTERAGLFDPMGALNEYDPLRAFGPEGGRSPLPRTAPTGLVTTHLNGAGPAGYFNRVNTYYPTLRVGRGANQSLSPISRSSRMSSLGNRAMSSAMAGMYGSVPSGVRIPGR